jgi:hypothetical protein
LNKISFENKFFAFHWMKFCWFFVLLIFCLHVDGLLLITGKVTNNSVRILYEGSKEKERGKEIQVSLTNTKDAKETQNKKIILENRPRVIKFNNLSENSEFKVYFGSDDFVKFKTFSNEKQDQLKFIVLSCDRYVDDKDDEFFKEMMDKDSNFDVALHLGDQIYADIIGKNFHENKTYEDILEEFRELYRFTWSTPIKEQFLRTGSHLMIPDDHDIINNVDAPLLETRLKKLLFSGRQAYYEYQYQLLNDIYDENGDLLVGEKFDSIKKTFDFHRIGNIGLGLLDTRFKRTFEFDNEYRLLGKTQFELLSNELNHWSNDSTIEHVLICTGTPLGFFSPILSKIAYTFENPKETYPSHPHLIDNLLKIFDLLKKHEKVKLVTGDVHQFAKSKICDNENHCIDQLVSSGISKGSAVVAELKLVLFFAVGRHFTPQNFGNWTMDHYEQVITNNYGVIDVSNGFNWYGVFREPSVDQSLKMMVFDFLPFILLFFILKFMFIGVNCCFCLFRK